MSQFHCPLNQPSYVVDYGGPVIHDILHQNQWSHRFPYYFHLCGFGQNSVRPPPLELTRGPESGCTLLRSKPRTLHCGLLSLTQLRIRKWVNPLVHTSHYWFLLKILFRSHHSHVIMLTVNNMKPIFLPKVTSRIEKQIPTRRRLEAKCSQLADSGLFS